MEHVRKARLKMVQRHGSTGPQGVDVPGLLLSLSSSPSSPRHESKLGDWDSSASAPNPAEGWRAPAAAISICGSPHRWRRLPDPATGEQTPDHPSLPASLARTRFRHHPRRVWRRRLGVVVVAAQIRGRSEWEEKAAVEVLIYRHGRRSDLDEMTGAGFLTMLRPAPTQVIGVVVLFDSGSGRRWAASPSVPVCPDRCGLLA